MDRREEMEKIIESTYNNGYANGMQKAWEMAKLIVFEISDNGLPLNVLSEIYGDTAFDGIIKRYRPEKAIELYEKWKKEQNIKIGDVLVNVEAEETKMIVISVHDSCVSGIGKYGVYYLRDKSDWKPTGKNFVNKLEELFDSL